VVSENVFENAKVLGVAMDIAKHVLEVGRSQKTCSYD
jgi:hypothetical protein